MSTEIIIKIKVPDGSDSPFLDDQLKNAIISLLNMNLVNNGKSSELGKTKIITSYFRNEIRCYYFECNDKIKFPWNDKKGSD